jgi:hypothetical protein
VSISSFPLCSSSDVSRGALSVLPGQTNANRALTYGEQDYRPQGTARIEEVQSAPHAVHVRSVSSVPLSTKPFRQNTTTSRPQVRGWIHHQPYPGTGMLTTNQVQGYQQPPYGNVVASNTQYQPGPSTHGSQPSFYRKYTLLNSAALVLMNSHRARLSIFWSTQYATSSI